MHERTFVKSGGRDPAVGWITRVQRCSAAKHRQSPACWRHCSYKRVLRTTGGLRSPLLFARIRPPAKLRLFRCTNARSSGAAGVSPPCVALTHLHKRLRKCSAHCRPTCWRTPLQSRLCNHGGLTPPAPARCDAHVCRRNCDFCDARTHVRQERRASARCGLDNARATVFRSKTSAVSRMLAALLLQTRSPHHGGLRSPLLFARVCPPAKLRLLRCTNAHASRAAGVSPPWVGNRTGNHDCVHVHVRSPAQRRQSSERSRQCPCKCVTANHGGLTLPALVAVAGERESKSSFEAPFHAARGLTPGPAPARKCVW